MSNKNVLEWQEIAGNWVLIPSRPQAIIHFLGGAFVGTAPQLAYRCLLEELGEKGYLIIATPFLNTLDHITIARTALNQLENTLQRLSMTNVLRKSLPIYGIGHSMGCKLHLLIGSLFEVERAGNIFMSFNNYAAKDSIPMVQQISDVINVEFTPSPAATRRIIFDSYQVRRNLLIKFKDDTIDQSMALHHILQQLFPEMITLKQLSGNHQTPLGQNIKWQVGQVFTPLDAIGQWLKQEVLYKDLHQLSQNIQLWLNPFPSK